MFKVTFERWIDATNDADLPQLIRDSLAELKALTASLDGHDGHKSR